MCGLLLFMLPRRRNEVPLSVGYGDYVLHFSVVAPRGRGRGTATALRFGIRPPVSAFRRRLPVFGFGAGPTDQKARAPVPFLTCGGRQVTSGRRRTAWFALLPCYSVPFP